MWKGWRKVSTGVQRKLESTSFTQNGLQAAHASDEVKAQTLLSLVRKRGHLVARLDPLRRGDGGPWKGWGQFGSGSVYVVANTTHILIRTCSDLLVLEFLQLWAAWCAS